MPSKMTESEAKVILESEYKFHGECSVFGEALTMAINALEKQIEMKKYCDENGCTDCPYHNTSLKDNRCMNDFIIDRSEEE